MPFKNRLRIWLPRIAVILVIYTIYSWLFQLFAVCGQPVDPETGFAFGPGRDCTAGDALGNVPSMLASLLPLLFMAVYLFMFIGFQYGVFIYLMSRGRSYVIYPNEYDVTFDDVRGQRPVVESVQEVVKLFRGFREFKELGGYPPHGILFEGPPGTGKTLMAKAVAGTVGVPFIYAPATGFANATFLGAGVLRLMLLFRKAKKFAKKFDGCVIFIDEIDAVGSRGGVQPASVPASESSSWMRFMMGAGMGGGGGTINELLVQMDGLVMPQRGIKRHLRRLIRVRPKIPSYNILIIAATNRAGALDPALLRPGRFDRKIHVGLPDKEGRKDIIQYYLAKVAHEGIDLGKFAQSTIGFSPAQIKNIINEGLIVALQDGRESLGWSDVWQAKLIEEIGLKQHTKYTPKEKEMTAVHEAGHAVASREFQAEDKQIQVISIVKRENTLGVVHTVDLEERFSDTKEEILEDIKVFLAGQAAEEIWFNTSTTGPSSDLYWCTVMALNYIGRYGMGKRLLSYSMFPPSAYLANDFYSKMLDDPEVREEVDGVLKQCKAEVTTLLKKRKFAVEMIRDELLEHDELVGDQLEAVMSRISDQVAASTPKARKSR